MEEQGSEKKGGNIPKIRTLKDDLAKAVKSGGVSTAKIAIKEQKRRRELGIDNAPKEKNISHKILIILISFIFITVAIGIFGILTLDPSLSFLNKSDVQKEEKGIVPLFENVEKVEINRIAGKSSVFEKFDQLESNKEEGKVKSFEFYINNNNQEVLPATATEFFTYIQASPERLDRVVDNIIYGLDGNAPFLLLEINSFELAFSEMLQWEDTMTRDLEPVFQKIREQIIETEIPNPQYVEVEEDNEQIITEDSEIEDIDEEDIPKTIIETTTENWRSAKYYDQIFFNKDSRVLRKDTGEQGIIYTFLDERYLLISTEIPTIEMVLNKISEYYIANY